MIWMIFTEILKNTILVMNVCLAIKKRNPIVTESFIRGRKLNISFVFVNFILLYQKILD